jgi:hypothetical protein
MTTKVCHLSTLGRANVLLLPTTSPNNLLKEVSATERLQETISADCINPNALGSYSFIGYSNPIQATDISLFFLFAFPWWLVEHFSISCGHLYVCF